jgi:hypothetical protein
MQSLYKGGDHMVRITGACIVQRFGGDLISLYDQVWFKMVTHHSRLCCLHACLSNADVMNMRHCRSINLRKAMDSWCRLFDFGLGTICYTHQQIWNHFWLVLHMCVSVANLSCFFFLSYDEYRPDSAVQRKVSILDLISSWSCRCTKTRRVFLIWEGHYPPECLLL